MSSSGHMKQMVHAGGRSGSVALRRLRVTDLKHKIIKYKEI